MEIRLARVLIYVSAIMCYVPTHRSVVAKESDETALREALLLVELLKSEYARVLREKSQPLSNGVVLDEKDLGTCATTSAVDRSATTALRNIVREIESSNLKPYTPYGYMLSGFKEINKKGQPSRRLPFAGNSFYNDFRKRRFNDRDYYESYNPPQIYRKMDYDNVFGPQPNETNPTSPTTQRVTSDTQSSDTTLTPTTGHIPANRTDIPRSTNQLSTSRTTTNKHDSPASTTSQTTTHSLPNTISTPQSSTGLLSTIHKTITKMQKTISTTSKPNISKSTKRITDYKTKNTKVVYTKRLNLNIKETTNKNAKTNAPEEAQILAELEQELESDLVHSSNTLTSSSRRWRMTWPPSTRVHLARSTRYPIPLPENHAFCYTNPESPLCRTFI